jgi:hypothetical protein
MFMMVLSSNNATVNVGSPIRLLVPQCLVRTSVSRTAFSTKKFLPAERRPMASRAEPQKASATVIGIGAAA